uniref:Uncharacterized protein n=1 Tax=Physcomitrium patens TaxID=3218 RepID=A0A2K1JR81_PHYPA|nr:hypothetical protein PHYPA_016431 [Physcomitrium patens]
MKITMQFLSVIMVVSIYNSSACRFKLNLSFHTVSLPDPISSSRCHSLVRFCKVGDAPRCFHESVSEIYRRNAETWLKTASTCVMHNYAMHLWRCLKTLLEQIELNLETHLLEGELGVGCGYGVPSPDSLQSSVPQIQRDKKGCFCRKTRLELGSPVSIILVKSVNRSLEAFSGSL